ncbi:MAG TPA: hypothetical protein VGG12_07145, partial [Methylovirgula sp.]
MKKYFLSVAFFASLPSVALAASAAMPLSGCYERNYEATYVAQHKGQIVTRVTLSLAPNRPESIDQAHPVVTTGTLKIWVRGTAQSFDSLGACLKKYGGLACDGSLSAAEADPCKSAEDGVGECRIDSNNPGSF